jgi:hypothetical protein
VDPDSLSEQERSKLGVVRLPDTLEEAFANFEQDTGARELLHALLLCCAVLCCMSEVIGIVLSCPQSCHAALREALCEDLGGKLITSFLAVHKSELDWTASMKRDSSTTDDYIARMAAELYDRY